MKRKLFTVLGIVIVLAGVCIFLYPIVRQAYTAHKQKEYMNDVKQQIIASMNEQNENLESADSTNKAEDKVDNAIASDAGNTQSTNETDSTSANEIISGSENNPAENIINTPEESSVSDPNHIGEEENIQIISNGDGSSASSVFADGLLDYEDSEDQTPEDEGDTLAASRLIGQKCLGIITIDKINLVYAIVEGTEDYNIGVAIGHFPETPGIGEEGNCALAGHNGGVYGRYFGDIKKLSKGDEVVMTNLKGMEYTYVVSEIFTCEPTDVYVVEDLGVSGKYLTMVTCTQHGTKRLIVRAKCTTEPTTMKGLREQR